MVTTPRVPSVYEVLVSTPKQLTANLRINAVQRIHWTGHARSLPRQYLPLIGECSGGSWKADEARGIPPLIDRAQPHLGRLKVSDVAFRVFKSDHRLLSPMQFCREFGAQPWRRSELSFVAVHKAFDLLGEATSLGVAAAKVAELARDPRNENLGMLPVEIVLWSRAFHLLLSAYGLTYIEWQGIAEHERLGFWEHWANSNSAADLRKYMHEPAALTLNERGVGSALGQYNKSFGWDCTPSPG